MMGMHHFMPAAGQMSMVGFLIAGVAMLVAGRRLFWLFVGLAGFVVGLQTAPLLVGPHSVLLVWAVGLVCGAIGVVLALFFQHLAIAIGGFMAGSAIAVQLTHLMWGRPDGIVMLIGGIVGAVALFLLFDWALILLSATAGASLIVQAVGMRMNAGPLAFILLAVIGVAIQAGWLLADRRRKR